jgi:hypothetical protein
MRLHTDFHDYYDNAVGYGIDDNVHYNRFTKKIEIRIKSQFDFPRHRNAGLLGFCGKIYPFIEIKKFDRKYDLYEYGSDKLQIVECYFAYSFEEYVHKKSEWKEYTDAFEYQDHSRKIKLKQFFEDWKSQNDDIFLEYKVPIWVIKLDRNHSEDVINPRLKDYGFDRIKDAFTTFQEISMYLSNIIVEQKETAIVEDKFRIEQHGFDLKKSFRKEKKS